MEITFQEALSGDQAAYQMLHDRGCSYPGDCGQYLDSNANGFCDRGECQESNTAPLVSGYLSTAHGKGRRQRGN